MIQSHIMIFFVLFTVMSPSFRQAQASCCSRVMSFEGECSSENFISVAGQEVLKGSMDARIPLPGLQTATDWSCGSTKVTAQTYFYSGNQLRIDYHFDGTVHLTLYCCDNVNGPTEAGSKCAVQETSLTCPSTSDLACVYEIEQDTTSSETFAKVKSVSGEVAAEVRKGAVEVTGSTEVGVETSVTGSKVVSTSEGYFLEIPPGTSFCAIREATTVREIGAPSGFTWECSLTKIRLISVIRDSNLTVCSNLPVCDNGVCEDVVGVCNSAPTIEFSWQFWATLAIGIALVWNF